MMEKVFSVPMTGPGRPVTLPGTAGAGSGFQVGQIEKVLEPGRFIVVLKDGARVTAMGSPAIEANTQVRVFPPTGVLQGKGEKEAPLSLPLESGSQWTAFIPLGFGGKRSAARLQVFVEKKRPGEKGALAVYLIFWVRTEKQGELQWSVYIKGRQVALQVFASGPEGGKGNFKDLVMGVEKNLENRGFKFLAPTVFLRKPFRVPEGFRLNLRG